MTMKEHIELRSTLHALSNRDFICSQCQSKYTNRQDATAMLEKVKRIKGCTKPHSAPVHQIRQGKISLAFRDCIGNYFSYSAMSWINFYNAFEKGAMPFPGGYMDQPSKLIDVMNLISNHKQDEMLKAAQAQKIAARTRGRARGGQ